MTETRREKELRFRRMHVAEAAEVLFAEKGFDGTTMDQLALRAELSKSTLYTLFQSKDELLFFMHLVDARVGFEMLKGCADSEKTGLARLACYGRRLFEFYQRHPAKLRLRTFLDSRGVDRAKIAPQIQAEDRLHRYRERALLQGILEVGIEDGSLRSDLDLEQVMLHFVYSLHAIAKQSLFPTHIFDLDPHESFANYLSLFLRGVRGQGE